MVVVVEEEEEEEVEVEVVVVVEECMRMEVREIWVRCQCGRSRQT
jgi:hypothetical protein